MSTRDSLPLRGTEHFDKGVFFTCTGCGACCQGEGDVTLSALDADRLAEHFAADGIDRGLVLDAFTEMRGARHTLKDQSSGDCIFWRDGCTVYDARPTQCRTFPFWVSTLRSKTAWKETRHRCEGIGEGRHYSRDEILAFLRDPDAHETSSE